MTLLRKAQLWNNSWFVGIILLIVGLFAGFYSGEFLEELHKKANVDFIMSRALEDNYLPITVDNIGQKPLTKIELRIKSCYMDTNKTYFINELKEGQKEVIKFEDKKTTEKFRKLRCDDLTLINWSEYNDNWIKVYKHNKTGNLAVPYQEFGIDVCGYCFWDIYLFSDQFNATFKESTYSPIVLIQTIGDGKEYNEEELIEYSPIRLTPFDDRMYEALS